MSILITGGCGYIGSHVAWALVDAGTDVVILDDLSTGSLRNSPPSAEVIVGDVGDREVLGSIFCTRHIEAVIHLAGKILPHESLQDPLLYFMENASKSFVLMQSMLSHNVRRLIFSSTAAVYGRSDTFFVKESAPTNPISPYGRSKLFVEEALRSVCEAHEFRAIALRYFNVAGADPKQRCGPRGPNPGHLIRTTVDVALGKRERLEIFGSDYPTNDGTCIRDYVHVSDLAEAHRAALHSLDTTPGLRILNCGYGCGASVLEVLRACEALLGSAIPHTFAPRRPGDAPGLIADASELRATCVWQPKHTELSDIIASALAWDKVIASERH